MEQKIMIDKVEWSDQLPQQKKVNNRLTFENSQSWKPCISEGDFLLIVKALKRSNYLTNLQRTDFISKLKKGNVNEEDVAMIVNIINDEVDESFFPNIHDQGEYIDAIYCLEEEVKQLLYTYWNNELLAEISELLSNYWRMLGLNDHSNRILKDKNKDCAFVIFCVCLRRREHRGYHVDEYIHEDELYNYLLDVARKDFCISDVNEQETMIITKKIMEICNKK